MPGGKSQSWPRWWELDDWLLLGILVPAATLLRGLRRIPLRPLRIGLSTLVVLAVAVLIVLLVIAIGGG